MLLYQFLIFTIALFAVIKGSTMATRHAGALAESFHLSKYTVGFLIVAVISILPETFISITAALGGEPEFGLGTLFGSNVADLTLIFALIIWYAGRNLKVETKILKNHVAYPLILMLPLLLGLNGYLSRLEGLILILAGGLFYYLAFRSGGDGEKIHESHNRPKEVCLLLCSMVILLVGAHYTVSSASEVAYSLGVSSILVGMLIVGLGTTMPELFFSLKSIKRKDDSLAIGDLLGTVLADATIVVGILALVSPFSFPVRIIYITGVFMVSASFILFWCMRSGHSLSWREAWLLFVFWVTFVLIEFLANS